MHYSRSLAILIGTVSVILVLLWIWHLTQIPNQTRIAKSISDRSLTSPLNQPGGNAVSWNAYEVYSSLYREPQVEVLAFAADSVTDIPQVDGSCLKPTTEQEREMEDDFVSANRESHRWEAKFLIPGSYRLLSNAEAEAAQECLEHHRQASVCAPFRGIEHIRYLGVPGFDHSLVRALVSVERKCGRYCGSGGIFEVERVGRTWQRAPETPFVRECSWMY